jgi:hypothetical protein
MIILSGGQFFCPEDNFVAKLFGNYYEKLIRMSGALLSVSGNWLAALVSPLFAGFSLEAPMTPHLAEAGCMRQ